MTIEEAGYRPEALAAAVHDQLPQGLSGPTPVKEIAYALDIHEIRAEPLENFEGALLTVSPLTAGSILVNNLSHRSRQRFTIAHELLHFLNPHHEQTSDNGFWCSKAEIAFGGTASSKGLDRHQRKKRETNRFAVELLLPRHRLRRKLCAPPDLEAVIAIAREFDVSKEAAARYYAEGHDATLGIAFSKNGRLRYWSQGADFPFSRIGRGMDMPVTLPVPADSRLSEIEGSDPLDWFTDPGNATVAVQTLHQQNGHAMTLVAVEHGEEDDEDEGHALNRDPPRFKR